METTPTNEQTETSLRKRLKAEGFDLSPRRENGETGVDIIATKGQMKYHIEVIGFKKNPPQRTKDFCVVFFGAISRLKNGAQNIVIALPERFGRGLRQRANQYGEGWRRIGEAFPELQIWLIRCEESGSYERTTWNEWLSP